MVRIKVLAFIFMFLFSYSAHTDIAAVIVSIVRVADFHASLSAGMDKRKGIGDGVEVHHNAYVAYTAT
jgi:hypothetical protein